MFPLHGIGREQVGDVYEGWARRTHPGDLPRVEKELQAAIQGDGNFDTEFRVTHPDGSIRNICALAKVEHDSTGRPVRMIGTNPDITATKQREAADLAKAGRNARQAEILARSASLSTESNFSGPSWRVRAIASACSIWVTGAACAV